MFDKNETMNDIRAEFILDDMLSIIDEDKEKILNEDHSNETPYFDKAIDNLTKIASDIVDNCKYGCGTIGLVYDCLLNDDISNKKKVKYIKQLM